ncbi:MAG: DUF2218 domain-containing protein [Candidatus Limnocylindria bacterium]
MLIAEARVVTERSGRYLLQLCSHIDLVARSHPDMQAAAEWSDDRGVITFGASRCTLRAEPGALWLAAQAPDAESLAQIQARIGSRLEDIGRRDGLTVTWTATSKGHDDE